MQKEGMNYGTKKMQKIFRVMRKATKWDQKSLDTQTCGKVANNYKKIYLFFEIGF